jgi:hypothetical protein
MGCNHTYLSLDQVRMLMRRIPGSDVMVESLNTDEDYTGERWFQDDE